MQTFNQLFFKKKQIFSYFFKEISEIKGLIKITTDNGKKMRKTCPINDFLSMSINLIIDE